VETGLSQAEAASELGTSFVGYNRAESDKLPVREINAILAMIDADELAPTAGEKCALARRRSGWTLRSAADRLEVSHVTYLMHEHQALDDVVHLWRGLGYIF
jgi:transcriptional regulator with XRE-family HTH domain